MCRLNKSVLLGMSGGTDSSVAALLLLEQKYVVSGLFISFFGESSAPEHVINAQKTAFKKTESLCEKLSIPLTHINASVEFYHQIITYFTREFREGRTPFPCAKCNPEIKWKILHATAQSLGIDYIATGHYTGIEIQNGIHYITMGADADKDQSFFLWGLSQEILKKTLFPLSGMHKTNVREYAKAHGFDEISTQKDSMGICFLGNTDYRPFLTKELKKQGVQIPQGWHVTEKSEKIAQNNGYIWYTVGQRKQLGVNLNTRVFVSQINADSNTVVLSDYASLYKTRLTITQYYFHTYKDTKIELIVKIRYRKQATPCTVKIRDNYTMDVYLKEPLEAIAPGQTAVFYDSHRVVGGGFIV